MSCSSRRLAAAHTAAPRLTPKRMIWRDALSPIGAELIEHLIQIVPFPKSSGAIFTFAFAMGTQVDRQHGVSQRNQQRRPSDAAHFGIAIPMDDDWHISRGSGDSASTMRLS